MGPMPKHAYIHIPFCTNKCYYCDFNIFVWQGDQWVDDYLDALERELNMTAREFPPQELETIYIGGGTPSILNEKQIERLLSLIRTYFPAYNAKEGEFTLEANPGTLSLEKLKIMREYGVNRLSIGVQTFNDELLKRIGRIHTARDAIQAVELAREAGFDNITVDLMLGLPGQTLEYLKESIEITGRLQVDHVSAYGLKVEEQTLFGRWQREGKLSLPPEEVEVDMYLTLVESLATLGYEQYEISNFARPGKKSRHNLAYWLNREYYGIGAGAHGYVNGVRHENIGPVRQYIRATMEGLPRQSQHRVTPEEKMEEMMFLGLRITEGISFARFEAEWGRPLMEVYGDEIEKLQEEGLLEIDDTGIRLTRRGLLLGNEVFARFLKD